MMRHLGIVFAVVLLAGCQSFFDRDDEDESRPDARGCISHDGARGNNYVLRNACDDEITVHACWTDENGRAQTRQVTAFDNGEAWLYGTAGNYPNVNACYPDEDCGPPTSC